MDKKSVAKASVTIEAPVERVWDALVDPEAIKQYLFGSKVTSDWREGGSIVWKGEWKGAAYEDRGTILQFKPKALLQHSHCSPLSGLRDTPENSHTVTVELAPDGGRTDVRLSQDNNAIEEERAHSERNWAAMLTALKGYVEG